MSIPTRTASIDRKTSETAIKMTLSLDGEGNSDVRTGIPFFDHMLTLFARHGLFDLTVEAKGDIEVDFHHTVEDTGIALGQALAKALADKKGIRRYGSAYVPMDEALARVVVDCSGRPFLAYEAPRGVEAIGLFPFQLVEEFLRALAVNAGLTLHVSILAGRDAHHMAEGIFKALGRALDIAVSHDERVKGIPSTKGVL
ncbi:MAG: imidazoleglycerol-phosphate dehydratase HisB [Verrucomicrobia bacterium]|jgi:imidazoleglycerol-phosphate dehydratase|nr:imidazoleglycerol-phosphate dehydratase HisB [Verrucomicrobiota bacterium]